MLEFSASSGTCYRTAGVTGAAGMVLLPLPGRSGNCSSQEVVRLTGQPHTSGNDVIISLRLDASGVHRRNQHHSGNTGQEQARQEEENGESTLFAARASSNRVSFRSGGQILLADIQILIEAAIVIAILQIRKYLVFQLHLPAFGKGIVGPASIEQEIILAIVFCHAE